MTVRSRFTDAEFIEAWNKHQSAVLVAKEFGRDLRGVHRRRLSIEKKMGITLGSNSHKSPKFYRREHNARTDCTMTDGVIVVGSDVHIWPGANTIAQDAFLRVIDELRPQMVVLNGDVFDGAGISRWPKASFGHTLPTVKEELDAVSGYLTQIEAVAGSAKRWWTIGNHDMRFESKLANIVPEFEGVPGFSLQEQFPLWPMSISMMVNNNLMIKHRYRNGVHATWNNAVMSGLSICTGHLHRLQSTVMTDYNGTRWGIDCGTLGETVGPKMSYGEDNPANHCSGFAVLTVRNGRLVQPELCAVTDGAAIFRGRQVA